MKGFFKVSKSDGYGSHKEITVCALDVSAIEYGRSDAYRGIAGIKIVLKSGETIWSSDDSEYVRKAFEGALVESNV